MRTTSAMAVAITLFLPRTNAYHFIPTISLGNQVYVPSVFVPIRIAHAALACTAWAILFPLGGILIRWLPARLLPRVHAVCQIFASLTFFAAASLGIWMARGAHTTTRYHPVIGLLILSLTIVQLLLGSRNHYVHVHRRDVGRETLLSVPLGTFHVWFGRFLITLGIINGGLGFHYSASAGLAPKIAYGIVAGVVWVVYVAVNAVWREYWRPTAGFKMDEGRHEYTQDAGEMDSVKI